MVFFICRKRPECILPLDIWDLIFKDCEDASKKELALSCKQLYRRYECTVIELRKLHGYYTYQDFMNAIVANDNVDDNRKILKRQWGYWSIDEHDIRTRCSGWLEEPDDIIKPYIWCVEPKIYRLNLGPVNMRNMHITIINPTYYVEPYDPMKKASIICRGGVSFTVTLGFMVDIKAEAKEPIEKDTTRESVVPRENIHKYMALDKEAVKREKLGKRAERRRHR